MNRLPPGLLQAALRLPIHRVSIPASTILVTVPVKRLCARLSAEQIVNFTLLS
jgi:hypothetical protein